MSSQEQGSSRAETAAQLGRAARTGPSAFIGYMCQTDFEHDMRGASDGAKIYPSESAVRRERACVSECGIVAVRVTLERVVQPADWSEIMGKVKALGDGSQDESTTEGPADPGHGQEPTT